MSAVAKETAIWQEVPNHPDKRQIKSGRLHILIWYVHGKVTRRQGWVMTCQSLGMENVWLSSDWTIEQVTQAEDEAVMKVHDHIKASWKALQNMEVGQ